MKHILLIAMLTLIFLGCKKEINSNPEDYLGVVKKGLLDSLSTSDFQKLDFSASVMTKVDSVGLYVLRVPFKSKSISEDFVIVRTNKEGKISQGKIVHQVGKALDFKEGDITKKRWDGAITIFSLGRQIQLSSPIVNGYITALHSSANTRAALVQPSNVLPEVIISYTISSGSGISWSSWMMVQSFFLDAGSGGGSWGSYYFNSYDGYPNSGGGGGGYSGGGPTGGGPSNDPPILIDLEYYDESPEIDLQKFINCFNSIPDAGSTCSIEISTDIPVDNDPNKFYNFNTGSPGHAFITVRKSNGTQSASQNIGFYPKSGYKASTYAPTAGKLVNNEHHEFNASLKMALTPAQLSTTLIRMQQLANLNYDVDEYNCTDWALDIFNHTRTNKLEIPLYGIPGSPLTQHTRTPQGLYNKLQQMSTNNHPEKGNITIGIVKGYAGGSTGPCN